MATKKRDYKKEYRDFHGKPEQIKNRAKRNKARNESSLEKGDPREIDHIKPLSKGGSNSKKNTRIVSKKTNRKKGAKMTESELINLINQSVKKVLTEKAKSKAQQQFFAVVKSVKDGDKKPSEVSPEIRQAAKDMTDKDITDFASTPTKDLPKKVKQESVYKKLINNVLNEVIRHL